MRWQLDRRWAPAAAAIAVAAVVGVAVVLAGGDDDARSSDRDLVTLPPASETTPSPTPARESPPPATAAPAEDPDTPVSYAPSPEPQEPSAAPPPAKRSPAPQPSAAAPRPAPSAPPPAPEPSRPARAAFAFDAAYGTDEPQEVVVQYGDSSSCPHERVTHEVQESADRVVVTLTADAADPGRACTADYRQRLVPVRLQQPLGDRVLVDGSRGERVPVDRSCSRPFANPPPPKDCEP